MAGPTFEPAGEVVGQATVTSDQANIIATSDGEFHRVDRGYVRNVFAVVRITSGTYDGQVAYLVQIPSGSGEQGLLLDGLVDYVAMEPDEPDDPLAARQAQYDADASTLLGPRPA